MEKLLDIEIVSPEKTALSGAIESISAPGSDGEFQVLYNHAPFVSTLEIGHIWVVNEFREKFAFATSGGIFEVRNNKVTILAETIETKEDIDIERAKKALERAEDRIKLAADDVDILRAKFAIKKALNRLKIIE